MITFKPIDDQVARQLIAFVDRRNIGKTLTIGGVDYTLDFISHNTSAFHRSRGLSIYFRAGRSIIRISDHWSASNHFPRCGKLNCGSISDQYWRIDNTSRQRLACARYAGRFPFEMLAGRCGLTALNKTVDHWKERA